MTDRATLVAYLMPPANSFWKWVDDGRSVAWQSGDTIAFWQEVLAVVQRLAPTGLPPLSAIVLLLAATRDGWSHNSSQLQAHAEQLSLPGGGDPTSAIGVTLRAIGHRLGSDTASLRTHLDRIAGFPSDLRHPLQAKVVLAEMVFENLQPAIAPEIAGQVIAELRSAVDPSTFSFVRPVGNALRELIASIDALKKSAPEIDADRLRLRMRTGLDELIECPKQELGPSQRVRQLMGELSEDPELGGLSCLARTLLAAVQVPRALRHQDAVRTGGVADITNRGQLDRLLISELANDDLTLAVRIAVNEALYIQRESPPRDPPKRRVILIDCGIRLWGIPRVYAAAVALALAANGDINADLAIFRPDGKKLVPIELSTREGVVTHLESLDTHPHFGEALPAFTVEVSQSEHESESFLITQEDVLDDPEFRTALQQQDRFNCYAATVARDGTFRLWSLKASGRTLLRQAVLDLDQLLARSLRPPPVPALIQPALDLPVILSADRFPLLLPPGFSPKRVIGNGAGDNQENVAITRDRRLIVWRNAQQGAHLMSDRVPSGRLELFRFTNDGRTVVALFGTDSPNHRYTLWVIDLSARKLATPTVLLGIDQRPLGVELREETVYILFKNRATAYGFESAEPLATLDTTGFRWIRGRFYNSVNTWFLLAWNGSQLIMEPIPPAHFGTSALFEVIDYPAPLFMGSDGEIRVISPTQDLVLPAPKERRIFHGVRADGRAIVASSVGKPIRHWSLVFSTDPTWIMESGPIHTLVNTNSQQRIILADPYPLRKQFLGVLIDRDGGLLLVCHENKLLQPRMVGNHLQLVDPGYMLQGKDERVRYFDKVSPPAGTGYRLRAASWDGKGRVFLDSRGLLHLKSSNHNIPEVTLVLINHGPLAGWSSDGRVYGPKYFHESNTTYDPKHLEDLIRRFTKSLR